MKKQMLKAWQALRKFCAAHKVFAAILLVQAVVVLYCIAALFAPAKTISVALGSFAPTAQTDAVSYTEQGLTIENDADVLSEIMLTTDAIALGAGAYTLDIDYSSTYNIAAPTASMYEESAVLLLGVDGTQSLFVEMEESLKLTDAAQTLQTRIWVSRGQAVDNLQLSIYYNGAGQLEISAITLQEQVSWRYLQLLAVCLVFALCNAGIYLVAVPVTGANQICVRRLRIFFLLLGIAAFATLPLFVEFVYYGHDMMFHNTRIASVAAELSNGQFPVRMMTEMLNGYGYANSLFYCDIFLYLPAVLYNCMLPLQAAYQVYVFVVNLATAAIAYYAFAKMAKSTSIALVGASVYTLASYRLINVYIRAAVGEYTAMAFFPLVILGLWGVYQSKKPQLQHWLPLALGMAGIIQCHVLSVEIIAIFLGIFCLLMLRQTFCLARIKALVCAVALCLGLTAWFVVPFVQSFLQIDMRATDNIATEIQSGGLTWASLFSLSAFSIGTTSSAVYMLGWGLWCGVLLAICLMVQHSKLALGGHWVYKPMQLVLVLGGIATLFTLKIFPWNAIGYGLHPIVAKLVNIIQFPWRYLAVASICFALVAVLALVLLQQYQPKYFKVALCGMLALNLALTGLFYTEFVAVTTTRELYTFTAEDTLTIGWGEYKPADASADVSTALVQTSSQALEVLSYQKIDGVAYLSYQNTSDQAETLLLPIWCYPNYQAIDTATGEAYSIAMGEGSCIAITVPAGSSASIQVAYVAPLLWHIAEGVTLCSWAGLAFVLLRKKRKDALA